MTPACSALYRHSNAFFRGDNGFSSAQFYYFKERREFYWGKGTYLFSKMCCGWFVGIMIWNVFMLHRIKIYDFTLP